MTQTEGKKLLEALGWIAYGQQEDRYSGISILRASLSPFQTRLENLHDHQFRSVGDPKKVSRSQGAAHADFLLTQAARIGEKAFKSKWKSRTEHAERAKLLRRVPLSIDSEKYAEPVPAFAVIPRVEVKRNKVRVWMEPVGPKKVSVQFLIAYAFWHAVAVVPLSSWRTFSPGRCKVPGCKKVGRDLRPTMKHGKTIFCDEHQQKRRSE